MSKREREREGRKAGKRRREEERRRAQLDCVGKTSMWLGVSTYRPADRASPPQTQWGAFNGDPDAVRGAESPSIHLLKDCHSRTGPLSCICHTHTHRHTHTHTHTHMCIQTHTHIHTHNMHQGIHIQSIIKIVLKHNNGIKYFI